MIPGPAETTLIALIGDIYDCVIDPSNWPATIERIRQRYGFFNAILGVNEATTGRTVLQVVRNVPPDMLNLIEDMGHHVLELWGGWSRLSLLPLEEPVLQSDATDPADWPDNPYFRAFGMPQGVVDTLAIGLALDSGTVASLAFGRHQSEKPLTPEAMDELRILAPHLRRAVINGRMLDVSSAAAANFAAALNASTAGVVLVDDDMRLIHANRAAAAMLDAHDPIRAIADRLDIAREAVPGTLRMAVERAGRGDGSLGGKGMGIPALRRPAASASPPTDVLSLLFDLTPAEGRIFAYVAEGRDRDDIARTLAIAPTTYSRIYAKTGCHSRADLVRLATDITPPG